MTTAVLFGITGYAGGHIARELLSRGVDVVGVARDATSVQSGGATTTVSGSIHDASFVAQVTKAADVVVVAVPSGPVDGKKLIDALPTLLSTLTENGARLGIVGGAGSLHVAPGGPKLVDTPDFPAEYKGEAQSHSDVLDALRESDTTVDWFYVSPAAGFGAHHEGTATGRYRIGNDVLLTDSEGDSEISGADYATAFADEILTPTHHQARFTVAY